MFIKAVYAAAHNTITSTSGKVALAGFGVSGSGFFITESTIIPFLGLVVAAIYGGANVWINYRKMLNDKRFKEEQLALQREHDNGS